MAKAHIDLRLLGLNSCRHRNKKRLDTIQIRKGLMLSTSTGSSSKAAASSKSRSSKAASSKAVSSRAATSRAATSRSSSSSKAAAAKNPIDKEDGEEEKSDYDSEEDEEEDDVSIKKEVEELYDSDRSNDSYASAEGVEETKEDSRPSPNTRATTLKKTRLHNRNETNDGKKTSSKKPKRNQRSID